MISNKVKELLRSGRSVVGPFFTINAPDLVEIAAICGAEFGVLDMEHGPSSPESTVNLIRAAECRGLTPLVRVPNAEDSTILKALDIGAHGIIVPQVNDRATAERIVRACHYHPIGTRGLGLARAADYESIAVNDYFALVREQLLIVAQCESQQGLENVEQIAATDYVDVVFLGPFDLSQSLGIPGETDHPLIRQAADRIVAACKAAGKIAGVFAGNGELARQRMEQGFRLIAMGTDIGHFASSVRRELAAFRG
ncbi:MAG: 4-hydroxy-2-oxovalerate aldolase [Spirochaetaceae bacterium]|nr:MAG: 4-hydroxy-2-oxovalerate aldolase [Spirochaetaceae bacterium]